MPTIDIVSRARWMILNNVLLALCSMLHTRGLVAQQAESGAVNAKDTARASAVDQALSKLKTGEIDPYDARVLANAKVVQAIPGLEKQFASETNPFMKESYAQALVKLQDGDALYWNYLADQASRAIDSDFPATIFDAQGKEMPGTSDAALTEWANKHQVPVATAEEELLFYYPGALLLLAGTGDRRAIPLLERALSSRNYSLQLAAADGLTFFDDPALMPVLIATCKKDPPEMAKLIARRLAWSSDPEAQHVAGMLITKEEMDYVHQMKAQGKTFTGDPTLPGAQQSSRP